MNKINNDLWLFDYNQGAAYEAFSKCQDVSKAIEKYLHNNFNFGKKTILEIGAGSGKFTSFLARSCSKLYVVERGVSLMQINKEKNSSFTNIDFILSDIRDLIIEPNCIDLIFASWSMTSMREYFDIIFEKFKKLLRNDGIILLVENAGNDEFCKIMGLEEFTSTMNKVYKDMGFIQTKIINTIIKLPNKDVFYNAFPNKKGLILSSLEIQHAAAILKMQF